MPLSPPVATSQTCADPGSDTDVLEGAGHGDRGGDADVDRAPSIARSAPQLLAHRGHQKRIRLGGQQCDPQTAVAALGNRVAARDVGAIEKQRRRDVAGGIAGDAVEILQVWQQMRQGGFFRGRRLPLDVAAALDGVHGELGQRLERHGPFERGVQAEGRGCRHVRRADRHLHQPVRRHGGAHPDAQDAQKREALAFGNQVGAIQDGVGEPREQIDQRAARIPLARVGPLRGVGRDPADQVGDQVVEAAIVERGRPDRHQPAATGMRA